MINHTFSLRDYVLSSIGASSGNSSSGNSSDNSSSGNMGSSSSGIGSGIGIGISNNSSKNKCSSCDGFDIINFCLNDNDILCKECTNQHSKSHNLISLREFKESTLFLNYHEFTESYANIEQYNLEMDKNNKLFHYDIENDKITFGKKWSNCGIDSNDPFLTVSFTGFSGSGKSSIIGSLLYNSIDDIKESGSHFNHPIPGKESSTNSTSSDINSYVAKSTSIGGAPQLKYLILDSEGMGGTSVPIFIEDEFEQLKIKTSDEEFKKMKKEIKAKRSNVVQLLYPKLLTIISDIIVFTFKGSPKEKSNIFKQLKKLSYISSSSSNIQFKPHLIIVLNKQTTPDILDDIEYATNDYFSGSEEESLNKFKMFYQSISVIYIPNIKENNNNSFQRYKSQLARLQQLISNKLVESLNFKKSINFDYGKEKSMSKITSIIDQFNKNPNLESSFDYTLFDISASLNRSIVLEEFKVPDQHLKVSNDEESGSSKNEEAEAIENSLSETVYYVSNVPVIGLHRSKNSHFIFNKTLTNSISSLSSLPPSTLSQLNNLIVTKSPHQSFSEEYTTPIKDINSSNNYTKIISNTVVSNVMISKYLITYFKLCYFKLVESGVTRRESFYLAKIKIKSRILSIFNKFKSRNYLDENNIFEDALDIFSEDVDQLVPCKQIISNLECINLKNSHHYHQTKQRVDKDINFNEKRKRTIKIPYIEQGKFDPLYRYEDFKVYLKKEPIKTDLYYLDFKNCEDVCIGCFLEDPIVKLPCGHIVCTSCSLENGDTCFIEQCTYIL